MNEQNNNSEMTGTGYLVTRVTTALGAIPVEGATVTVRDGMSSINDRGAVIATLTTNKDGLTPKIKLPAPAVLNSTSPGSFFSVRVIQHRCFSRRILPSIFQWSSDL